MTSLCEIMGHVKLTRKYYSDTTAYVCRKCKSEYDVKLLGKDICPSCNIGMKHPKMWSWKCEACGYNC